MRKTILVILIFIGQNLMAQKPYRGAEYRTIQAFTYGKFEVRMRSAQLSGMLSSFFTYHEISGVEEWNEIDIENMGRYTDEVQFNTITPNQTNHVQRQVVNFNPHDDFHIYGIEWTPDYVAWLVDSTEIYRQTGNHIQTLYRAQKLMMNIWPPASIDWAGTLNDNQLPVYAYYDWVKVYAYTPGKNHDFTLLWKDDFNQFQTDRWQKATHTWDGNNSQFIKENAVLKDGYLILCLTKPSAVGYRGGAIPDNDHTPPYVFRARLFDTALRVRFSEPVDQATAENPKNYVIPGLQVLSAKLFSDGRDVELTVSGRQPNTHYTIIAMNIVDRAPAANKISIKSVSVLEGLSLPAVINLGAGEGDLPGDRLFDAEQPYGREGGAIALHDASVDFANTTEDNLFRSEVRGIHAFRAFVPNGSYKVTLYFAETEKQKIGERIFNVFVEDSLRLSKIDIFKQAGRFAAYEVPLEDIPVNDGKLDISFQSIAGEPELSALKIEKQPTALPASPKVPVPQKLHLNLAPNPANPESTLTFKLNHSGDVQIALFDILGRRVWQKSLGHLPQGAFRQSLKLNDVSSGLYLCVVEWNNRPAGWKKLVVLK